MSFRQSEQRAKLKWGQSILLNHSKYHFYGNEVSIPPPKLGPKIRQFITTLLTSRAFKKPSWLSAQEFEAANAEVEDIGIDIVSMGPRQIDKEVLISDASVNYVNFQTRLTRGQVYYWHLTVAALRKYLKLTAWFNNIRWSQLSVLFMHKLQTSSLHKIPCASAGGV